MEGIPGADPIDQHRRGDLLGKGHLPGGMLGGVHFAVEFDDHILDEIVPVVQVEDSLRGVGGNDMADEGEVEFWQVDASVTYRGLILRFLV